jgi:hypothetical protein
MMSFQVTVCESACHKDRLHILVVIRFYSIECGDDEYFLSVRGLQNASRFESFKIRGDQGVDASKGVLFHDQ